MIQSWTSVGPKQPSTLLPGAIPAPMDARMVRPTSTGAVSAFGVDSPRSDGRLAAAADPLHEPQAHNDSAGAGRGVGAGSGAGPDPSHATAGVGSEHSGSDSKAEVTGRRPRLRSSSGGSATRSERSLSHAISRGQRSAGQVPRPRLMSRDSERSVGSKRRKSSNAMLFNTADLEVMRYTFAVVLHNTVFEDAPEGGAAQEEVVAMRGAQLATQKAILEALVASALTVKVLQPEEGTKDMMVLLVSARGNNGLLLVNAERQLESERFLKYGVMAGTELVDPTANDHVHPDDEPESGSAEIGSLPMSRAREVFLTQRILESTLRPFIYDSGNVDSHKLAAHEVLHSFFPLHDEAFNTRFLREYVLRPRRLMDTVTTDIAVNSLREMFGERVAFYFAFTHFYTLWLLPLAALCFLYYICVRFVDWGAYLRGLSVVGFCVPVVWGTLFLKYWKRKSNALLVRWQIDRVPEAEYQNHTHQPTFKRVMNELTGDMEKVYDPHNHRLRVKFVMVAFAFVNLIMLMVIAVPFIQWYAYAKMAPTCDDCRYQESLGLNATMTSGASCGTIHLNLHDNIEEHEKVVRHCIYFISCFTSSNSVFLTDRWVYILIQGIVLGLVLDVLQFEFFAWATTVFTRWENWYAAHWLPPAARDSPLHVRPTESEFERALIRKQFGFLWVNWFFWFLTLAFFYIPFGESIFGFFHNLGWHDIVPVFGWQDGIINLDEAFVTPLIVTQSLNLFLETFLPVIGARAAAKASESRRKLLQVGSGVTKAMQHGVSIVGGGVRDGVGFVADNVKDGVRDGVHKVAGGVKHVGEGVRGGVGKAAAGVGKVAGGVAHVAGGVAGGVAHVAGGVAGGVGRAAGKGFHTASRMLSRHPRGPAEVRADVVTDSGTMFLNRGRRGSAARRPAAEATPPLTGVAEEKEEGADDHSVSTLVAGDATPRDPVASAGAAEHGEVKHSTVGDATEAKRATEAEADMAPALQVEAKAEPKPLLSDVDGVMHLVTPPVSPQFARASSTYMDDEMAWAQSRQTPLASAGRTRRSMKRRFGSMKLPGKEVDYEGELHTFLDKLNLDIVRSSEDSNALNAAAVLAQATREEYHPRKDYLDMVIQFGYITMFTTAWPLAPICAIVNNLLEVRGDAFKIMHSHRRPIPREDKGIGEWYEMLKIETLFSLVVVSVMIALSTGEADFWVPGCNEDSEECSLMTPDLTCLSWGTRVVIALGLEHIGLFIIWVIQNQISDTSASVAHKQLTHETKLRRKVQENFLPSLPRVFVAQLRMVFDMTDVDANNRLSPSEARRLIRTVSTKSDVADIDVDMFFRLMDMSDRGSVTFAEVAFAVNRASHHPTWGVRLGLRNVNQSLAAFAEMYGGHHRRRGLGTTSSWAGPARHVVSSTRSNPTPSKNRLVVPLEGHHGGVG